MVVVAPRLITQEQALDWIDEIVNQAESDGVSVQVEERESALGRFGENQIRQNLQKSQFEIRITSYFGQQSASVTTVEQDLDGIIAALRRSEELAKIAPADPEWVPLLEPQTYSDFSAKFDEETYTFSPLKRGELIQKVCQQSEAAGTEGSGILSTSATAYAIGNSVGLRAYDCKTNAEFSFTAKIGQGSSWGSRNAWGVNELPIQQIVATTLQRATISQNPTRLEPDTYPVVFSAGAIASLIPRLIWNMSARSADEGRSFFSGKEGTNLLGEKLFNEKVNLYRDPSHPLLQSSPFSGDGFPCDRRSIIENGVVKMLSYDRYWASKKNQQPTGGLFPLVMEGTDQTLADLIANTERGIFVNRAWYVRSVNNKTMEVTGMTRDGAFWIENGKLAYPIYNLRFNETIPNLLKNIEAIATPERHGSSVVPAVKVSAFHFSSVTDSI